MTLTCGGCGTSLERTWAFCPFCGGRRRGPLKDFIAEYLKDPNHPRYKGANVLHDDTEAKS